jgi:hypothetical protein
MAKSFLPFLLVGCFVLAGCAQLGLTDSGAPDAAKPSGNLVRAITMSADPDLAQRLQASGSPDALLDAVGSATFTYTHDGDDVASSALHATYLDRSGHPQDKTLDRLGAPATLKKGTRVEIPSVQLASPVRILSGSTVLARRGDPALPWLTAGGYPLPVAALAGKAAWTTQGDGTLHFQLDKLLVHDGGGSSGGPASTTGVRDVLADLSAHGKLTTTLAATPSGDGLQVKVASDGTFTGQAAVEATTVDGSGSSGSGSSGTSGFKGSLEAGGSGSFTLGFDGHGALSSGAAEGHAKATGSFQTRGPGETGYTERAHNPLFDSGGSAGPEPFPATGAAEPTLVTALRDLWGMDLVPGDSVQVLLDSGPQDWARGRLQADLLVGDAGPVQVGAGTFDALRIDAAFKLHVEPASGSAVDTDLARFSVWLDRERSLPLRVTLGDTGSATKADLDKLLDSVAQVLPTGTTLERPTQFAANDDLSFSLELTQQAGPLRIAPMAVLLGLPSLLLGGPLAFVGGVARGLE